jgi:putative ABC transport system permease protein
MSKHARNQVRLTLALKLLLRDWRSGEVAVLLAALIVAVTAITAVALFTDRVRQAVAQGASEALAADLRIESVAEISDSYANDARALGLETARVTNFRSVIVQGTASSLADVRGVSAGYPLRGEVRVADALAGRPHIARGVPNPGETWAEPGLLARLGLAVGDVLRLGALDLRITQTLEFRPDEGWRFFEIAPTLLLNLQDIPATQLLQPGSVVEHTLLVAGAEREIAELRTQLESQLGIAEELEDYRDARPEVRASVRRAERFLMLAAMVSVLLGGVAVAMAGRRFVARRLDAAALMKCLGAQHRDVLRLTLTQLLTLVLVAATLGSALGFVAQLGLSRLASGLVEIQLPPAGASGIVLGPLTALAVAFGFALPALLQLRHVPPARVLRHDLEPPPLGYVAVYGAAAAAVGVILYWFFGDLPLVLYLVGGVALTFAALYGSGRLLVAGLQHLRGGVGVAWRFGIANVARRGQESSVQIVAFGIGIMVLLLLTVVRTELMTEWQASLPPEAPNHFAINIQPDERERFAEALQTLGIPRPEFTPLARARISHVNGQPVDEYDAKDERARDELGDEINLTWASALPPDNELLGGQWWQPGDTAGQLSIEEELLDEIGLQLGDTLTFSIAGEAVTLRIASERRVQWDSFRPNFFMLANPGVLADFPHTFVTSFHVADAQRHVTLNLARELPSVSVIDIAAVLDQVRQGMAQAALAVQYVFLFTLAAGVTVLLAAIQATREERLYESAVLRTLGARRGVVLKSVAAEFAALGALSGTLAAAGAGLIGYVVASRIFEVEYVPSLSLWALGLVAGVGIVGVCGVIAVRSVISQAPVSVLRRG